MVEKSISELEAHIGELERLKEAYSLSLSRRRLAQKRLLNLVKVKAEECPSTPRCSQGPMNNRFIEVIYTSKY